MIGQRILATLLALPALLVLIGGIRNLITAWQASYSGGYWIEHDYMGNGIMMLVSAMIGLGCCLQLGHRRASWAWSVIPAGIALFALVMPNTHHPESHVPVWKASHRTTQGVRMLAGEVDGLAQASGTFVCPPPPEVIHASVFAHQGKRLLYEVRCVSNASRPFLAEPAPKRPGVLVMAVSSDGRHAWFTATSLRAEVSDRAVWLLARDHTPFSVEAHVSSSDVEVRTPVRTEYPPFENCMDWLIYPTTIDEQDALLNFTDRMIRFGGLHLGPSG